MHIAAQEQHLEAVRLLLKAGNGNMSRTLEKHPKSPRSSGHLGLVNLVEAGAIPLYVAAQNGHAVVRLLLEAGAETRPEPRGNTGVSRLSCWAFACCSGACQG